jgi:hypothetical protein
MLIKVCVYIFCICMWNKNVIKSQNIDVLHLVLQPKGAITHTEQAFTLTFFLTFDTNDFMSKCMLICRLKMS